MGPDQLGVRQVNGAVSPAVVADEGEAFAELLLMALSSQLALATW